MLDINKENRMNELLDNKNVQKLIKPFIDNGYVVKSFEHNFESPIYSENTPRDEDCVVIFGQDLMSDDDRKKWNVKEFKIGGKLESASATGTTEYFIVEFEADEHLGYMVLKVKNGVFIQGGNKIVTKTNDVKLFEVGFVSKKFFEHFGEYKVLNQKEFNDWKKYQQKSNPNTFLLR